MNVEKEEEEEEEEEEEGVIEGKVERVWGRGWALPALSPFLAEGWTVWLLAGPFPRPFPAVFLADGCNGCPVSGALSSLPLGFSLPPNFLVAVPFIMVW